MKKLMMILLALLLCTGVAAAQGLGEARTDAQLADYEGNWVATVMVMGEMHIPMADMGMAMQVVISAGKAMILEGMDETAATECEIRVEGGVLHIRNDAQEVSLTAQLYAGGQMALLSGDGTQILLERISGV